MFERWLLRPLMELCEIESGQLRVPEELGDMEAVIDAERIDATVEGLYTLLSCGIPNRDVAGCMIDAIEPLFRLFVKATSSKTAVRAKVLRHSDASVFRAGCR